MKSILPTKKIRDFFAHTRIFSGLLLFVVSLLFAGQAYAIDTQSISAYPTFPTDTDPRSKSWFIYSLAAGITRQDSVTVVNNSTNPINVKLYAVDSTKTSDGTFALAAASVPRVDVGSWVKLSTSNITLQPKEKRDIPFTFSVPADAKMGEHSGGIIFELTTPTKVNYHGMGINVITRVGVRIYETVPGAAQLNLSVSHFSYSVANSKLSFAFTVENNGTVHVTPQGYLEVKDMFGRSMDRQPLDSLVGTIVPGQPEKLQVVTSALSPILGWESASVVLYYSPTKAAVASILILPNLWVIFGLSVLVLALIAGVILKNAMKSAQGKEKHMPSGRVFLVVGGVLLAIIALSGLITYLFSLLVNH